MLDSPRRVVGSWLQQPTEFQIDTVLVANNFLITIFRPCLASLQRAQRNGAH